MDSFVCTNPLYIACDHIKRKAPNLYIDPETIKSFTTESNVLPLFEKKVFDLTRMRNYSLKTNEKLQCCWGEFLRQLEGRQRTPFQFPNANDFHFYNHYTRFAPSQSLRNQSKKQLRFGAGAVSRGYDPVPNELHTRKTENVRKPRPVRPRRKIRKRVQY